MPVKDRMGFSVVPLATLLCVLTTTLGESDLTAKQQDIAHAMEDLQAGFTETLRQMEERLVDLARHQQMIDMAFYEKSRADGHSGLKQAWVLFSCTIFLGNFLGIAKIILEA